MSEQESQSNKKKLRVGLVFGGRSAEHEVSLVSARAVLNALDPEKYDVTLLGITREGRWLPLGEVKGQLEAASTDPAALMSPFNSDPAKSESVTRTALLPDPSLRGLPEINAGQASTGMHFGQPLDVVLPMLHGPYGEDGTMQGLLELANIPYVGCGVLPSAVGMDKVMAREVFKQHGLPVLDYYMVKRKDWEHSEGNSRAELLSKIEEQIGYPCFIKPVNMGSSVGISKVRNREELAPALDKACRYDRKIMIEKGLNPRELEVAVLGNDDPQASVVGEILISHKADFYDYTAKYQDEEVGFTIPADIPAELSDRLRAMAVQAFLALDCAGMTRVDFFQDRDSGQVYLNEVNTIPGFTPVSMYPMMWEKSGLPYRALLDRLIELALERHADKNRNELR
ncbi:MAG TPA: D-alanine--D-alanine ligase family protein [Chloroflexia bacterium]|nr:D-alanine--D-alanine ligase family protein [Chloroflexia bacterium]